MRSSPPIPALRLSALLAVLVFHASVSAQEAPPGDPAAAAARAESMRTEATTVREAAEARFAQEEVACYARFLVNRCIDQARQRRVAEVRRARALDVDAARLDLAEKNRRFVERQALDAETAPGKAIERSEQEAGKRAESEARLRSLSEKDAARVQREQEGKSRALREAEARSEREAAQARRRAAEAQAAMERADQARLGRAAYEEKARKAAERKAAKAAKVGKAGKADKLMPGGPLSGQ